MLRIIRNQPSGIKGILWYQGCEDTNADDCDAYYQNFADMVAGLRTDTGIPFLPFFTFQLNRYTRFFCKEKDIYWGKIREAQRQAAKKLEGVYVSPTTDCILSDAIHNSGAFAVILGQRLAKVALSVLCSKKFLCMAPDLRTAVCSADKGSVRLDFDNVYGKLYFYEASVNALPFTIEDENSVLDIQAYKADKNSVFLELSRTLGEKGFVHCAYEQDPKGIMPKDYETHLPALCFYHVPISVSC